MREPNPIGEEIRQNSCSCPSEVSIWLFTELFQTPAAPIPDVTPSNDLNHFLRDVAGGVQEVVKEWGAKLG